MSSIYAMKRANGDWFAIKDHGHLRVPMFSSHHEAMEARARSWGMLLFKPVILDELALEGLISTSDESRVCFCLDGELPTKLNQGCSIDHAGLALLIREPTERS